MEAILAEFNECERDQSIETIKKMRIWCVWKRNPEGKKVPRDPKSGCCLEWKDPSNWSSFEDATKALNESGFQGLGFILPNGYYLINLDSAYVDGKLNSATTKLVTAMDSYTEISPSGKGVHIVVRAEPSEQRNVTITHNNQRVEIKKPGTFVTFTGNQISDRSIIKDSKKCVEKFYQIWADTNRKREPQMPAGNYAYDRGTTAPNAYYHAALRGECEKVRSASTGRRNEILNNAAFKLGKYVGRGLDESTAEHELMSAARFSGLSEEEAISTIRRGLRDGTGIKRQIKRR